MTDISGLNYLAMADCITVELVIPSFEQTCGALNIDCSKQIYCMACSSRHHEPILDSTELDLNSTTIPGLNYLT